MKHLVRKPWLEITYWPGDWALSWTRGRLGTLVAVGPISVWWPR